MIITREKNSERRVYAGVRDGYVDEAHQYRVAIFHADSAGIFCGSPIFVTAGDAISLNIGETAEFESDDITTVAFSPSFLAYSLDREAIQRIALSEVPLMDYAEQEAFEMRAFFYRDVYENGLSKLHPNVYKAVCQQAKAMRRQLEGQTSIRWSCNARHSLFLLLDYVALNFVYDPKRPEINEVIDHIFLHFASSLTVGELADLAGMSENEFRAEFYASAGFLPLDYLRELRVKNACRDLAYTNIELLDIALQNGLQSQSNLSKEIRRAKGMPPLKYRNYAVASRKNYYNEIKRSDSTAG